MTTSGGEGTTGMRRNAMLDQQTIERLSVMKLIGMAEAFAEQLHQPDLDRLSFTERFA